MLSYYNLFRRKQDPDRCCVVRQDQPVPAFVQGDEWEFGGTILDTGGGMPAGFQPVEADEATRLAGFYMFEAARAEMERLQ